MGSFAHLLLTRDELDRALGPLEGHVLGLVCFGEPEGRRTTSEPGPCGRPPRIHLDLGQLGGPALVEAWVSELPVTYHRDGPFHAASNGMVLLGYVEADDPPGAHLDPVTYSTYKTVLRQSRMLGYPHLLRLWNHFPRINAHEGSLERYQQFCVGRHRAFAEHQAEFERFLPAGTAVGTRSGPLQVYFLAGREEGRQIENPRQVNAYDYPAIYGPKSPAFARATLARAGASEYLFVAGTSSIVGHLSRHPGDVMAQTQETLRNVEALIARVWPGAATGAGGLADHAFLKVYTRNPRDFETVKRVIERHPRPFGRRLYLRGDICRKELLIETEGILANG